MADTGPLIALARIGELDLLRRLYGEVVVPTAVEIELAIDSNRPGAKALEAAFAAGWLTVCDVADLGAGRVLETLLGPGEAEAITLAARDGARVLLVDDARARRVARQHRLRVVGVAGVLVAAKSRGKVDEVQPLLQQLARTGYYLSEDVVAIVLTAAGEDPAFMV